MNSLKPIKFGIELEISRQLVNVANHLRKKSEYWNLMHNRLRDLIINGDISRGWKLKTDSSCGGEIVSPPMYAPGGLIEIAKVVKMANSVAAKAGKPLVDGECGLHLHFDASSITPKSMSNLFKLLHVAEPIIFSMFPNRNFEYCAPIDLNLSVAGRFRDWVDVRDNWYRGSNNVKNKAAQYSNEFINSSSPGDNYDGTRYHGFNIHCFWKIGTVEFRYAPGTFDLSDILGYYEMCLAMVNTAISRKSISEFNELAKHSYYELCSIYASGYRGRSYVIAISKICGFSRNTIRMLLSKLRKNNPKLIEPDPTKRPLVIDDKNKHKFVYRARELGGTLNFNGKQAIISDRRDVITGERLRVIAITIDDDNRFVSNESNVTISCLIMLDKKLRSARNVKIVKNSAHNSSLLANILNVQIAPEHMNGNNE